MFRMHEAHVVTIGLVSISVRAVEPLYQILIMIKLQKEALPRWFMHQVASIIVIHSVNESEMIQRVFSIY